MRLSLPAETLGAPGPDLNPLSMWTSRTVLGNVPTEPGRSSSCMTTMLMSATYRIWVLCFSTPVQSSGVGARMYAQPPLAPLAFTLLPYGLPIQSCVSIQWHDGVAHPSLA